VKTRKYVKYQHFDALEGGHKPKTGFLFFQKSKATQLYEAKNITFTTEVTRDKKKIKKESNLPTNLKRRI